MLPADLPQFLLSGAPAFYCAGLLMGFDALMQRRAGSVERAYPDESSARAFARAPLFSARTREMRVSVARSPEDVEDANELVRRRYAWRGYETANILVEPHRPIPAPREVTLLAKRHDDALGTVTLRLDGPSGLRAEEGYPSEIEAARAEGRQVCELTRLALAETPDWKPVLASLFSLGYTIGRAIHGVTDVFIEVNPRHVGFYQRAFGFTVAAGEQYCERVKAPSVLLQMELADLERRLVLSPPTRASTPTWPFACSGREAGAMAGMDC